METPTGRIRIWEVDGWITRLTWDASAGVELETELLVSARRQLDAYFSRSSRSFDLPLKIAGSDFQRQVCAAMSRIPWGQTRSYGDIATELGSSAQAVGNACGANPIPVVIPCHRVLGQSGVGGFSGGVGVATKVELLRHEGGLLL